MNIIAKELLLFHIDKDVILFTEGEKGYFFFIVKSGKLKLEISNQTTQKILSSHIWWNGIATKNKEINENGYLTLIDFNTCSEIKDLTSTLAGTPHYIAPEILLGKGYGLSIGVVCFKVYYGYLPFGNEMLDPDITRYNSL